MQYVDQLKQAADFLKREIGSPPPVALVLGSGLGDAFTSRVQAQRMSYDRIPHFPVSTIVGHAGELAWGEHEDVPFCAMLGRVHLYEGLPAQRVVFAVRALALWGVEHFIITNAAGAVKADFAPGDLMLITDHINLLYDTPLIGDNYDELGERFVDLSEAYDRGLRRLARECANQERLQLRQGVYAAFRGPTFETPAEVRMARNLGADAVGMSTVPEVIALNHMGKKVLGISCLTNLAAGISATPLSHDEVLETTEMVKEQFSRLILRIVERIGRDD